MTPNKAQEEIADKLWNRLLTSGFYDREAVYEALASAERDAVNRCIEIIESFYSEFKDCKAKDCHHSERDNLIREILKAIQAGKDEG